MKVTLLLNTPQNNNINNISFTEKERKKAHFYVFCSTCKSLKTGKLRVRCHFCKSGAFTVYSDPQNWDDVLKPKRITGWCENSEDLCANVIAFLLQLRLIIIYLMQSYSY